MLKQEDFKEMEFNPFAAFGETPIFNHYRRLGMIKTFGIIPKPYENKGWDKFNLSTLLKFVIIFIDKESPLFEHRDFEDRRTKALAVFKIKEDSLEYDEIMENGLLFQDFVYEFFKLVNNHMYEQWFTYKQQIHSFNKFLRAEPDFTSDDIIKEMNSRRALLKESEAFGEKLLKLETIIFDDERLAKLINEKTVQNSIGNYAEFYADDPEWLHEEQT